MFCFKCGEKITENSKFCPKCGMPMNYENDGTAETPASVTPQQPMYTPTVETSAYYLQPLTSAPPHGAPPQPPPMNTGNNKGKVKIWIPIVAVVFVFVLIFGALLLFTDFFTWSKNNSAEETISSSRRRDEDNDITVTATPGESLVRSPSQSVAVPTDVSPSPETPHWGLQDETEHENGRGNSIGNIANSGSMARSGDWLIVTGGGINKMRPDGTENEKILDCYANYLNVVDGWTYFRCSYSERSFEINTIYKIDEYGDNLSVVVPPEDAVRYITVLGDWIYYLVWDNNSLGYYLHKIRTDGTEKTQLSEINIGSFCVTDDGWIYFNSNINDVKNADWGTYIVDTDGNNETKISDLVGGELQLYDNWLFFVGWVDQSYCLCKMTIYGSQTVNLFDGFHASLSFNVDNGWIYYSTPEEGGLYKMDINGQNQMKLSDRYSYWIYVFGDNIYFSDPEDDYNIVWVKSDGTAESVMLD